MQRFTLCSWSIRYPVAVVVVFCLLSAVFIWGNSRVEKGGILDSDVILRQDDPFRVMDRYVQGKVREGFEGREFIPFILNTGVHSAEDAAKILRVTRAAQKTFGDAVLSLATTPEFRDTGEFLLDTPYVNDVTVTSFSSPSQIEEWKSHVAGDASVFGLLAGKDFSWTSVVRYLPPGYDEIKEFRRTVEFLEGREIPLWEWLWKKDIVPHESGVAASGWTMGRGLIDQGLNVDICFLILLGVVFTLPIFWVTLGSLRAAVLCGSVMVLGGFVWTRGAMGLLGVPERVFSLLAYASVIVQGTSFALHKFSALKESGEEDRKAGWRKACEVDGLILTTALISAFGFVTLWSFGLKPIRELGVSATLGVVWLFFLATVFLPAFDVLTASPTLEEDHSASHLLSGTTKCAPSFLSLYLQKCAALYERLFARCINAAMWLADGSRPFIVLAGTGGLFVFVVLMFWHGGVPSRTRALEFIRGTSVEREARFLNQPGNVGFEFLDLLVEPRQGEEIKDPHFLARAWELQTQLKTISGSRETTSILGTVQQISHESFQKPLPETAEEASTVFLLIENRLTPGMQRQLYFPGGVRISVSYGTDDSVELGRFRDAVLELAHRSFPDLNVNVFNKVPLYPQVDKYVREGKITNIFSSQIGIALLCGFILWRYNRRLHTLRLAPVWGGLVMSLPLFFATAVMGLIMWFFQISLDMATASIGALTINAATDFSLYFVLTYQRLLNDSSPREALRKTIEGEGKLILADCLLNACCFLPLISSHFSPVRQLGWMMGVMLVACAAGSLLLMAALLPACVAQKEKASSEERAPLFDTHFGDFVPVAVWSCSIDRTGGRRSSASAVELSC